MFATDIRLIGKALGEQGEDRREVAGDDLGVNVLAQAQQRGSWEAHDLQTQLLTLAVFRQTPAQLTGLTESSGRMGLLVQPAPG
jgi:hypothetical protein